MEVAVREEIDHPFLVEPEERHIYTHFLILKSEIDVLRMLWFGGQHRENKSTIAAMGSHPERVADGRRPRQPLCAILLYGLRQETKACETRLYRCKFYQCIFSYWYFQLQAAIENVNWQSDFRPSSPFKRSGSGIYGIVLMIYCNPGNFRKRLIFVLFVNSWKL